MSEAPYEGALREPFGLTANVDDYVPSAAIERALHEASVALDEGLVPVVAGPPGLGKTLVLQLLGRSRRDRCQPVYVPFCSLTPEELASLVLGLLGWGRESDPEMALLEAARQAAEKGRRLLLLVDDAASLPGESAAQLAHWLNASGGALQVALAGLPGPSLRHVRDAFGDRAQPVALDEGLRDDEIAGYVAARVEAAGASPEIRAAFDGPTLDELARASGGNPRRLNLAAQAVVRRAFGEAVDAAEAARTATGPASGGETAPAPEARDTTARPAGSEAGASGVGEYRFVRGRLVGPDGDAPTEGPESVWREELTATERKLARRREAAKATEPPAPPVSPPPGARPAPPPGPDFDDDFGQALRDDDPLFDELGTPVGAAEAVSGEEVGPTPERVARRAAARDDDALAPRLEPPPPARRSSRPLLWIAAGVAALAFAVGAWTQLSRPEPPTRGATLTALRKIEERRAQEEAAVQPTAPAEEAESAAVQPPPPAEDVESAAVQPTPPAEDVETADVQPRAPAEGVAETAPVPPAEELAEETSPVEEIAEQVLPAQDVAQDVGEVAEETPAPTPSTPETTPATPTSGQETALAPEPEAATPPTEPEPTTPAAPAEPAPPPAETVPVAINATPWAVIEIDGEEVGETPLAGIELTTGRHRFRARMPDGSVRERVVRIDGDNTTVVFE